MITSDRTVMENAATVAHWLDVCSARSCYCPDASCLGCPWMGSTCDDGLMQEAAKAIAALYPPGHQDYASAKKVIQWLQGCIADNTCLAFCKTCPYANGCPSGLLRAASDLIRAACYGGGYR